jgi:hypothetical protein
MTGKPEVIRKRTLDRIGGFRPAKRDVVQKSAWRRSPLNLLEARFLDSFRVADRSGVRTVILLGVPRDTRDSLIS